MGILYNTLIYLASFGATATSFFSPKMKLFVNGRKDVFEKLQRHIALSDKTIWVHCASLGEFEQGVPIMEEIKRTKPKYKIVVSFFSPSGYEIKKNSPIADVVVYLPLDTPNNAKRFIDAIHPSLAIFVKYEIWPNYLFELQKKNIPSFLISALFRENQIFFKSYGGFMRWALFTFDKYFVQDENSKQLLNRIGLKNVTISGDTRFDRVSNQLTMNNTLAFARDFKGNSLTIVCGSTWPEDEAVMLDFINSVSDEVKFIIAPHKIESNKIEEFRKRINKKTVLHSEKDDVNLSEYNVLIIDCIGLLSKLYSYADIAFVGGAMGTTGLHNILEPATFAIPIVIGKNYDKFPEADTLKNSGGLFVVNNTDDCTAILNKLVLDESFREKAGEIAGIFIKQNIGATSIIMKSISSRI
ncbi:MAG TPA: glycosyltransferase N-terminal domain-containing protein [Aequorivita sp.]|nr:glycosyltransferase N-terminal domain-containing protein [Aequorivita sp.]